MQSELVIQDRSKDLKLDFFPSSSAEALPVKAADTRLVASEADLTHLAPPRDARFRVECDCACK